MRVSRILALGLIAIVSGLVGSRASSAPAELPIPTALASLQAGLWTLRSRDGSAQARSICLGDVRSLLQVQHGSAPCAKVLITDGPDMTVVNYSCAGSGNGRTTVRVETPRVVQIESQGIDRSMLFDWALEGRRTGACPIPAGSGRR